MKNPNYKYVDEFTKEYNELALTLVPIIQKDFKRIGINEAVRKAFKDTKFIKKVQDLVEDKIIKSAELTYGSILLTPEIYLSEIERIGYLGEALVLSEKIADLRLAEVIGAEIRSEFLKQKTYKEIAVKVSNKVNAELPKYLKDVLKARKTAGFKASDGVFKSSYKKVERLSLGGAPNQALKASYKELLDTILLESNAKVLKKVDTALTEVARYRAERIARTEIARSSGIAFNLRIQKDSDVQGVKYSLSTRHHEFDICDFHTSANLYGMGKGIYPKDSQPPYPFHPHCLCVMSEVFDIDVGTFKKEGGDRYLKSISSSERKKVLGVRGSDEYKKGKKWDRVLKNWHGNEKPDLSPIQKTKFK